MKRLISVAAGLAVVYLGLKAQAPAPVKPAPAKPAGGIAVEYTAGQSAQGKVAYD